MKITCLRSGGLMLQAFLFGQKSSTTHFKPHLVPAPSHPARAPLFPDDDDTTSRHVTVTHWGEVSNEPLKPLGFGAFFVH